MPAQNGPHHMANDPVSLRLMPLTLAARTGGGGSNGDACRPNPARPARSGGLA